MEPLQSGFRGKHSTATALLKITDDIFSGIDASECILMVLLDFSKAFDTVNHKLLLTKLMAMGFNDSALNWFGSYLSGRHQKVKSAGTTSEWCSIDNGVPQGSILGPLLFTILAADFRNCLKNMKFHQYADDLQTYLSSKLDNMPNTVKCINEDMQNISQYSANNGLKLNYDKCKFMVIGSSRNIAKFNNLDLPPITLDNHILDREKSLKNLGVIFDEQMSWVKHINKVVCKAYGSLRSLYRFKRFLSVTAKKSLCESLVLSHFNYCDTLFPFVSRALEEKIQKVQNSCVRFIYNLRKYDRDHISPLLIELDWLNMKSRRIHHSLTMLYKIDNNLAPAYLRNLIVRNNNVHNYNTRASGNFRSTRCRLTTRQNSFFVKIPILYNELPLTIKSSKTLAVFKKSCKARLLLDQASETFS
jgi:ribonuclease P/MRP protein subunit RPP40